MKKKLLLMGICICSMTLLWGCKFRIAKTVNLNDFFTYYAEGYDGFGELEYKFDEGAFEEYLSANSELDMYNIHDYDRFVAIERSISGSWSEYEDEQLSNGDVLTYTWRVSDCYLLDDYGLKFVYEDIQYVVDGLEEVKKIDPFEDLKIDVSGVDGKVTVLLDKSNISYTKFIDKYVVDPGDNDNGALCSGQTVTISLDTYDENRLREEWADTYGVVPERMNMEYKIDEVAHYISALDEVTDDVYTAMKEIAEENIRKRESKWDTEEKISNLECVGLCLHKSKDNTETNRDNYVYVVYKVSAKNEDTSSDFDYLYYTRFNNLIIQPDGSCEVDLADYDETEGDYSSWFGDSGAVFHVGNYYYIGYATFDALYADISADMEMFNFEDKLDTSTSFVNYKAVVTGEEE